MKNKYRKVKDTLGELLIPYEVYYGAQTQRAVENFKISGLRLPRAFIRAQGIIKASAASVNMELGKLDSVLGQAIISASQEVIEGKWDEHFVVDVYQAGAGTSQNMNVNEVIANRATELLGGNLHAPMVHPNDHVNIAQSTNDTFPSALNIASTEMVNYELLPAIMQLKETLQNKSNEFNHVVKSGRTHLQDAVPMKLGQEFSGYVETINKMYIQIQNSVDPLYEIGLGGNAIGTLINTHAQYPTKMIEEINKRTNLTFRTPMNIFSFMQNMNAPIRMMSELKQLSIHLIKITSDLRLLSSGPRTGLAEIDLPGVQPGSTIMPAKVNPAILEMVHMVSCQVIGYDAAITAAGMSSQLEINVMMPVMAYTLLQSIEILSNDIQTLVSKCINGITANEDQCKMWMENSLSLVTGLSPILGYDKASQIGMKADEQNKSLEQILQEEGLVNKQTLEALNPMGMI